MINSFQRDDIKKLKEFNLEFEHPWQVVDYFEKIIADYFGAPYAVATDCSTHALELCFRLINRPDITVEVPTHTYMSVPMMLEKINQPWKFVNITWQDRYWLHPFNIVDMSTSWKKKSYQQGSLASVSFQFKKHLPIGRGGIILLDDHVAYTRLQRMVRDGRDRKTMQVNDNITEIGYHYYMTPEDAARGITLFQAVQHMESKIWSDSDYFDLTNLEVFSRQ
jgi:dTDP-4-amino-4,6-dideoxygalactose transaminase